MALLPVSVLVYGSTIESIIDSVLKDVPEYLTTNGEQSQVESIESLVRSCPFSFYENLLNGEVAYTLSICINATKLIINPPTTLVDEVKIGKTKLEISMHFQRNVQPAVELELSAPVFEDAYVKKWFIYIPAEPFKDLIISEARKMLKSEIQAFISALG
uniref:SRPBCC family protein n=1 Tax=Echinococcus granulosus TaxID=6210 RepID=A0A068WXB4_ECHGR|nr:hypothetical protein EgrG_000351400 [Echinococcus granulosus]